MNILSLFDGMSCGQIALNRSGIKYKNYFASEIDKYAMQITQKNYPDTIQLGDVTKWESWNLPKIDLLIGGSPCQGFSFAGKQLNFADPRSRLFMEFVEILKHYKPKYFLLENVKMKKEFQDIISQFLEVKPIEINSALVSAQNRKRLYWTNIHGVCQPEDKGILLKDILENGECFDEKSYTVLSTIYKENEKSMVKRKKKGLLVKRIGHFNSGGQGDRIYSSDFKSITLSALGDGRGAKTGLYKINDIVRKLTPIECERLQTVPDNYTEGVSNTQRYKMLGNGWTVDVITHILNGMEAVC